MQSPPFIARSLRCGRCNGFFSVEQIEPEVICPYCWHREPLDRHDELRGYEEAVRSRVATADEQQMIAASLQAWIASRASSPRRSLATAYGLIIGLPLLLTVALIVLHEAGALAARGPGPSLAIGGLSYLGVGAYLIWHVTGRARRERRSTALEPARVACPTCGAPGMLTPGDAVDTCDHATRRCSLPRPSWRTASTRPKRRSVGPRSIGAGPRGPRAPGPTTSASSASSCRW